MERIKKYYRFLLPMGGLLCIVMPELIVHWLPFILGSIMVITSISDIFFEIKEKRYLTAYKTRASSLILLIMGLCFLFGQEKTITLMGITWGLLGLQEANEEIEHILLMRSQNEKCVIASIVVVFKIVLSLALLFDPLEKFNFHIILLGIEILAVTLNEKNIIEYVQLFKHKLKHKHIN